MDKPLVVSLDQMPGWLTKRANIMHELDKQLLRGLQEPGKGLTLEQLQKITEHRNPFAIEVGQRKLFNNCERIDWQDFYYNYFNMDVDFSNVNIPSKVSNFSKVIFIAQGLTLSKVISAMSNSFKIDYHFLGLNENTYKDVRTSEISYAICIRDRQEADEELKDLSVAYLKNEGINSITLMERLVFELKYWDEMEQHLDSESVTICAGSHKYILSIEYTPTVRWTEDGLWLGHISHDCKTPSLRTREVVVE